MIGVFDSGIGGLTVLTELAKNFPQQKFIYLGDTARLPYGTKSPATIRRYSEQNLQFLLEKKVTALVVACNSASTQVTENQFAGLPVFNVITPAARMATEISVSGRIGVLGTRATIQSKAYEKYILKERPEAQVFSQAAPLLVPLAEEGWVDDPVTNLIVYRYLQPLLQQNIDTLILGCTHYPILRAAIQKVAGSSVQLVECGQALSTPLQSSVDADSKSDASIPRLQLFCTDTSEVFQKLAAKLLQSANLPTAEIVLADLLEVR